MTLKGVVQPTPPHDDKPRGLGLVLERRTGESVVIGDQIEIKLVKVKGDRAHIGVVAPRGTRVERSEKRSES